MVGHVGGCQHSSMLQVRVDGEEVSPEVLRLLQVLQGPGHLDTARLALVAVLSGQGILLLIAGRKRNLLFFFVPDLVGIPCPSKEQEQVQ